LREKAGKKSLAEGDFFQNSGGGGSGKMSRIGGQQIVETLEVLGVTHVVWVPDSETGPWEAALEASSRLKLVRVCREGEAWPLAAGLLIGGQLPLLVMQSTGLFESGDALRHVVYDLKLPVYGLIGVRNGLADASRDSAKVFAEPIVQAWGLDCAWLKSADDLPMLVRHFRECQAAQRAGAALLAEGAM
jgi:sulfopyruvate decarboxylase subunit alpha